MVDIKSAVTVAQHHVRDVFGDIHDLKLEEVEQTSDKLGWLVTVSFRRATGSIIPSEREYKQVEIDSLGLPVAARIRQI
jgi:hypothetical protein